jgi:CheY-like chemotaxis protein
MRSQQLIDEQSRIGQLQQRLLSNVSHEIRTPLYGILGMLELCSQEGVTLTVVQENLACATYSAQVLMHLLNDVIDYHKLVDGQLRVTNAPFDVLTVARSCFSLFAQQFHQKGLTYEFIADGAFPTKVIGDEVRVAQVLTNLILNALKFTERGGVSVTVSYGESNESTTTPHPQLEFSVSDSGVGITSENVDIIFDKFMQVDNSSTRAYHGAGLGLAVVKELVTLMGGSISVHSNQGIGSVFTFVVPTFAVLEPEIAMNSTLVYPVTPVLDPLDQPLILVVDDNDVVRRITTQLLRDVFRCDTAQNGLEAVNLVRVNEYSGILMDMHMPVMDGIQATTEIRQFKPTLPIVGLTASCFEEDVQRCKSAGMNEVLSKPVTKRVLIDMLNSVITYRHRSPPPFSVVHNEDCPRAATLVHLHPMPNEEIMRTSMMEQQQQESSSPPPHSSTSSSIWRSSTYPTAPRKISACCT